MIPTLKVNEIFHSIQGESSYSGLRCAFVRLTGCNIRCNYCDTTYAYYEGDELEIPLIISKVLKFNCDLVEITGGEPLLQDKVHYLIEQLIELNKKVLIETNGTIDISNLKPDVIKIMDIKTPSSGMSDKILLSNLDKLTLNDELKFVISDYNDYLWVKDFITKYNLIDFKLLFSPNYNVLNPIDLVNWILHDKLNVRLNLQLHKYIWPPNIRGV